MSNRMGFYLFLLWFMGFLTGAVVGASIIYFVMRS